MSATLRESLGLPSRGKLPLHKIHEALTGKRPAAKKLAAFGAARRGWRKLKEAS